MFRNHYVSFNKQCSYIRKRYDTFNVSLQLSSNEKNIETDGKYISHHLCNHV